MRASSYDLLGFGESPKPEPYSYSASAQADALRTTLRWQYPLRKVNLVGHSMGGLIALEFAKRYPRKVRSLILSNVPILLQPEHHKTLSDRYVHITPRLRNEIHTRGYRALHKSKFISKKVLSRYAKRKLDQPEFDRYDLEHISEYAYMESLQHVLERQDVMRGATKLNVPTLIICGKRDKVAIDRNAQKLAETLPSATLLEVDASHQFPYHHPADFVELLRSFTDR